MNFSGTVSIVIQVGQARYLIPADFNGRSDPYVRIRIDGSENHTSKVAIKTLNPIWNENFVFSGCQTSSTVDIEVWDKDNFVDDLIGRKSIPVQSLLSTAGKQVWHTLEAGNVKVEDGRAYGEIQLRCTLFDNNGPDENDEAFSYKFVISYSKVAGALVTNFRGFVKYVKGFVAEGRHGGSWHSSPLSSYPLYKIQLENSEVFSLGLARKILTVLALFAVLVRLVWRPSDDKYILD